MKKISLLLTFILFLAIGFCYPQNKSTKSNLTSINEKYIGKYELKTSLKLGENYGKNSIVYDYFEIFEKNGKLQCIRESKIIPGGTASLENKNFAKHYECELIKIDEKSQKIIIKFINNEYSYTFKKNESGNYEIIILENTLVYEKK